MHVVATAGHVDHGKSTLVRVLTGMEPDRWAEERRRGLTIDLGYAWTTLPSGREVAFVDVPGHERFVTNMLAGVGPAPAVMLVVAADEGWMPQSEEHLSAVVALGTQRLLLVVTKADLAGPDDALERAHQRIAAAGLPVPPHVAVSAATGRGLDELRTRLDDLTAALPASDPAAPVRLWVDRAFTIRGAGTVATGTLPAGTVHVGDELMLLPAGRTVVVRGLQSLGRPCADASGVARVAVNLRGVARDDLARGMSLVTAGAWTPTEELDVLLDDVELPAQVTVHIGAAAVPARMRRLGGKAARLRTAEPIPLHVGDRLVVRDPASRRLTGADVADLRPLPLRRRGDAARVGLDLRVPDSGDDELARRGVCRADELRAAGLPPASEQAVRVGGWLVDPIRWARLRDDVRTGAAALDTLSAGIPLQELTRQVELPDPRIVTAVVDDLPDVVCTDGRVRLATAGTTPSPEVSAGVAALLERLAQSPLDAPDAAELAALGVGRAELAAAVRAGLLLRLTDAVYVASTAAEHAAGVLADLDGPFAVSAARAALGSNRRVVVPLLEHLDAARVTRRLPDGTRLLVTPPA